MGGSGQEDGVLLGWGSYLHILFLDDSLLDEQLALFNVELALRLRCLRALGSTLNLHGFRIFLSVEFYDVDISALERLTDRVHPGQIGEVLSNTLHQGIHVRQQKVVEPIFSGNKFGHEVLGGDLLKLRSDRYITSEWGLLLLATIGGFLDIRIVQRSCEVVELDCGTRWRSELNRRT